MGIEYGPATDMFIDDPNWVFTDALKGLDGGQLSIVLHKTACGGACDAISTAHFFANDTQGHKSVHFVVGTDGTVVQVVRLTNGAGGNCCLEQGYDSYWDAFQGKYGNLNRCTISIEHVDTTTDNSQTMTDAQVSASFALVSWLVQKFSIPISHIKGHNTLDPVSRARCPGPTYPLDQLLLHLEGGTMVQLTPKGEVADFVDVSQMEPNESEFACGYFAVGECKFAGQVGKGPSGTPEQLDQWADSQGGLTTQGVSIEDMHNLFHAAGLHYWDTDIAPGTQQSHDLDTIKAALARGYPVVATVAETSVFDLDLNGNPYAPNWTPTGNHVFTYTGVASDGNLLAHDTAAIQGGIFGKIVPQPRRYRASSIENHWASIVQLPWLPAIPSGDPLSWPPVQAQPAPTPTPTPTPSPTPTPVPDIKAQAFAEEWAGVVPGLDPKTGIAQFAYGLYWTPDFPGPALSKEFSLHGKDGKVYTAQVVVNGVILWNGSSAHYYPYKAG